MPLKIIQSKVKQTLAIAAGKGGVGKSTLTVLLAAALKRGGESVGLLDGDLYGPSLRQMLPEQRMPYREEGKWMPAIANGMKMLSYAFFSNEVAVRAPVANRVMVQFLQEIFWGELDWLLIDFPPGTGDIPITTVQKALLDGAIVITTPQKVAILDVRKTIEMFQKMKVPVLGIVENMSDFKGETPFGVGGGQRLAEELGIPFLGKIPLDSKISEGGDEGTLSQFCFPFIESIVHRIRENVIEQKGSINSVFLTEQNDVKIEWENGTVSQLRANTVQKNCPCAACTKEALVKEDVIFLGYEMIGRYGLRFDFSSGCSYGIYPFESLKRLHNV